MKTIGLIGGMSWESSLEYYRLINQTVKEILGGFHSAKILMYSLDFAEIEACQSQGDWAKAQKMLVDIAKKLEKGGADCLLICTNTMHKMAPKIEDNTSIPLLHIADATAGEIKKQGLKKVGLLGTRFTMEEDFYRTRIREKHDIEVIIPELEERQTVHDIIYQELCLGQIKDDSREKYQDIIRKLALAGAEGVILGCTEIPLLIQQKDSSIPLFDTTAIHARYGAKYSLEKVE